MDEQALKNLRKVAADCPSDLDLQKLHVGELPTEAASELAIHVAGCAACQARMATGKAGFAAYSDLKPRPILEAIQQRVQREQVLRERSRFLRRAGYLAAPLAAAAALCIVLIGKRETPPASPQDGVREKGRLALYVYKLVGERSERTASGDHFKAGDRLRFVADLPAAGHVGVLGVEASGEIYVAWPRSQEVPTLRPAGKLQELPGAADLDDTKGRETLYLVQCPVAVGPPTAVCQTQKVREAGAPPLCPSGCTSTPFILDKT